MVPWRLSAQAPDRRNLPQILCAPKGGVQDRSGRHRVHPGAARMGRDLEESLCQPRYL